MSGYYVDICRLYFIAISRHFQLATFRGQDPGSADQCCVLVLPESPSALPPDSTVPECVCVCLLAAGRDPDEHPTAERVM